MYRFNHFVMGTLNSNESCFFVGPKSDRWLPLSVTHSQRSHSDSCLVDLTDVTLAFEDANSKLLDFFSVADVDAEERVTTFWSIF